jgi:hypothetical protein
VTSFSASPPKRICSPDDWRDGLSLLSPTGSCSMLCGRRISFFRTLLVQVAAALTTKKGNFSCSFPKTWRNVWPFLSFIGLYPDCDVAKAWQSENFLGFCRHRQSYEEQCMFVVADPSGGDRRVAVICSTLITSKPRLTSASDMYSAGVLRGRWRITAFMGFRDLG